ncbi:MAG TPA: hypothetical protein DCX80_07035 [Chloroflexi bacterium]|nr:hypothetical protein [Chloroflexota bacterium]HBY47484.1 hypothetical protein [Chloroflexota bacterium]HRA31511.1 CapA family protein [Thermomicrobiales bacterium]
MHRIILTRRSFLRVVAATGATLLAACSGPEEKPDAALGPNAASQPQVGASTQVAKPGQTPSGTKGSGVASPTSGGASDGTMTVRIDGVPEPLLTHASWMRDRFVEHLGAVAAAASDSRADLTIRMAEPGAADAGLPRLVTDYVAVVSRRLVVRGITSEQLRGLWSGEITDWSALGSPVSQRVVRVKVAESAGPFAVAQADQAVPNRDNLATFMEDEPGVLAIIPAAWVDFRFRTLRLDDISWFRTGDATWPLQVTMVADVDDSRETGLAARAAEAIATVPLQPAVSMTWAGDIIMGRHVHVRMVELGDWAAPFRAIADELTWADVTISNLECSLSDSFETPTDWSTFEFKTDTRAVAGLQLAEIDVLNRANNHSFNFGVVGMDDTTDVLDKAGILHFGMGHTIEESRKAALAKVGGVTYAFLGYNGISDQWDGAEANSPGTNPLIDWLVVEDIKRELAAGHVVIPFFHWGTEYVYDPTEEQRAFAQLAIDNGAAMVMGSHPHWVQAVETYKDKSIVYSLGNFVFDQEWSLETKQGMIADVWMRGDAVLALDLVPVLIEDYHRPRRMSDDEAWPVLQHVWDASDLIRHG